MNCNANFGFGIEMPYQEDFTIDLKEAISRIQIDFPDTAKMMKKILKKAVVKEVAFAGAGSFDKDGKSYSYERNGNFKHKIIYYYKDIFYQESDSIKDNYTKLQIERGLPKEFVWCFDPCETELTQK